MGLKDSLISEVRCIESRIRDLEVEKRLVWDFVRKVEKLEEDSKLRKVMEVYGESDDFEGYFKAVKDGDGNIFWRENIERLIVLEVLNDLMDLLRVME